MADAMQGGIMTLPPEMGGMEQPPQSYLTPEDEAVFEQIRQSVPKKEFSNEMLNAAEQVDPQTVMQLRGMLRSMQLPPELVDLLQQMIDMLLRDPGNYGQLRAQFLAEGVPEELLPPQFDPEFFAAMDMALDQVSGPTAQGFAGGGMVMNPIAGGLASLGRYGDSMLAHITPQEAMMLRRSGGSGSINPATGLPEFWNLFSAIGSAFKSVGNAVKSVVKGIGSAIRSFAKSTVGRIVTSVALGFLLGPAAASMLGVSSAAGVAAISGFVGGAGSTLLAGGSFKDSLKTGAIGGLTAGAVSGISGGAGALQSGSYTGPTTVSGQWRSFAQGLAEKTGVNLPGAGQATAGMSDEAAQALMAQGDDIAAAGGPRLPQGSGYTNVSPGEQAVGAADDAMRFRANSMTGADLQARVGNAPSPIATGANVPPVRTIGDYQLAPSATAPGGAVAAAPAAAPSEGIMSLVRQGKFGEAATQGMQGAKDIYNQYLSPSGIQKAGEESASQAASVAYDRAIAAGKSEAFANAAAQRAYDAALPGTLATYGPIAGVGLGAAYLGGAFDVPPPPKPEIPVSGAELFARNPYLITPKVHLVSASTGRPYRVGMAEGGIASLAQGTQHYPRKTGPIDGPGTGTSDSIPAMLSDGEFVFTAKAVRAMGKGSRRKGAKRMYALMKALEKRA
jgi:hypothetical protein